MKKIIFFIAFQTILFECCFSQKAPIPNNSNSLSPKLVIGIVIDQMRYDYIYKYWSKYGNGGFKRLVNEGYSCKNTNFNYVPTYTGPGHASIYTGTTPSIHGIVGNDWYDREVASRVYCVKDKSQKTIGTLNEKDSSGSMSPHRMLTTTITDELRLSNNKKSKVIGISLKDRGAVLPAGHMANAAYWMNSEGMWISSSYYMKNLPVWVNDFNAKSLTQKYLSQVWNTMLPINQYYESLSDTNAFESPYEGELLPIFPHNLPEIVKKEGNELIKATPFGNSILKDFAIETMKAEQMGKGNFCDFLTLSFSSTDYLGHQFGPTSVEVEDCYLRLDKDIAELLKFLDTYLGKNNVLVFLTADHAAPENPVYLKSLGIGAGTIDGTTFKSFNETLKNVYGDSIIEKYINQQFYLNNKVINRRKLNKVEIENYIASQVIGTKGVAASITRTSLCNSEFNEAPRMLIQKGFNQKRSGDIMLNYEPGWMDYVTLGTTHGSAYSYDTHVPLLWYGYSIKPGSSVDPVNITDIAPTLALLLNIQFPNGCTGKPIQVLFK